MENRNDKGHLLSFSPLILKKRGWSSSSGQEGITGTRFNLST